MTNRTKSEFTSHCRIAATEDELLYVVLSRFAHARYSSRMIDRFLNWGDHGKLKSDKIKGRCQSPLCVIFKRERFRRGVLNIPACDVYVRLETTGGAIKIARGTTNNQ